MSGSRDIGIVRSPEQVVYRDIKKVGKCIEYVKRRQTSSSFVILVTDFGDAEFFSNLSLAQALFGTQEAQPFTKNLFFEHMESLQIKIFREC